MAQLNLHSLRTNSRSWAMLVTNNPAASQQARPANKLNSTHKTAAMREVRWRDLGLSVFGTASYYLTGCNESERKFIACQPFATGFTDNVTLPAGRSNAPSRFVRLNFV